MKNTLKLGIIALIFTLATGCSILTPKIKDYSNRSVVYGYLDTSEAPAGLINTLFFQYKPVTKKPYWSMATKKVGKGYIFYHYGLPNGSYQVSEFVGQSCFLIFCGNTIYYYEMPKQGKNGTAAEIKKPGVYFLGSYKYKKVKTGFFSRGKFDIIPAENPPSRLSMIEAIIKKSPKKEVLLNRLGSHRESL